MSQAERRDPFEQRAVRDLTIAGFSLAIPSRNLAENVVQTSARSSSGQLANPAWELLTCDSGGPGKASRKAWSFSMVAAFFTISAKSLIYMLA